ncbi:MAG: hypothetical protein AB1765_03470 [Candidatus Hydrogenedentota bacterium]
MREADYRIAKELKEKLTEHIRILDFMVFGSRAIGLNFIEIQKNIPCFI